MRCQSSRYPLSCHLFLLPSFFHPSVTCLPIMAAMSISSASQCSKFALESLKVTAVICRLKISLCCYSCVVILNSLFNTVLQGLVITEKQPFKISL